MTDALLELARTGRTSHPDIQAVYLAQQVNLACHGTVIAPWEVDDLPDEWLEVIIGMTSDLPEMKQARQKVDAIFEKYRKSHPTYRKH